MCIVAESKPMSRNMQELFVATTVGSSRHALVSNLSGTKLYYAKAGWGKLWNVFYCFWSLFFGVALKHKNLKKALVKTDTLFKELTEKIKEVVAAYKKNLTSHLEEDASFNPKLLDKYRWLMTQWNDATKPFLKLIHSGNNKQIRSLWHRYFGWNMTKQISDAPFQCGAFFQEIRKYQHLINLDRIIQVETPLVVLRKLSQEKKLLKEEENKLSIWIKAINENSKKMTVSRLHRGLKALVSHIETYQWREGLKNPSVATLEVELVKKGCSIFRQIDPKHLQWREHLKEDSLLYCNEWELLLGSRMGVSKKEDNNLVYAIQKRDDIVAVIGKNTAILGIKKKLIDDYSYGIRSARCVEVDNSGKCAIVERLRMPLSSFEWSQDETPTEMDQKQAFPIIGQIKWCVDQGRTPINLSEKYLLFDKQGVLKNQKVSLEGPFNYPALESFARGCSAKSNVIFKYIMKESGLFDHPYRKYYLEVVEKTLSKDPVDLEDLAAFDPHRITDPLVTEQAKCLKKEIINLQKRCLKSILRSYDIGDKKVIRQNINESIQKFYADQGTVSILWPSLEKNIIENFAKIMELEIKNGN